MLSFLSPLLLAGSALIAVPIILHLAMRQKPQLIEFPALRFVKQRREANRRRMRLRHLLLLLLRCAVLMLLAAALAKPILQSSGLLRNTSSPVAAALVFDTRPRMAYRHRNESRLDVAAKIGRELLRNLPPESEVVVLGSGRQRLQFDVDRGAAAERIEQLAITYAPTNLQHMLDGALRILNRSNLESKEIFLFTDMAASDWNDQQITEKWQQRHESNSEVAYYVIDAGVEEPGNYALDRIQLSDEVFSDNGLLEVGVDVLATGASSERNLQLFLVNDSGEPEKKGEQTVAFDGNSAAHVRFSTAVEGPGTHQGYVKFARSDNLTVDDVRYFTVRVKSPWLILIAAPPPPQRHARLLSLALAPPTLRRRGEAQYDVDVISLDQLAVRDLARYDAVWIMDPTPLKTEIWNRLSGYVSSGGGIAFALGGRVGLTGELFNKNASFEVLPAQLVRQRKSDDLYLAPLSPNHPVLAGFQDREGAIPWDRNPVFKTWELGQMADDSQVVISYSDGNPALVARHVGRGQVLVLTTPLADRARAPWNELLAPRTDAWPGFVLVNGMTEFLVGRTVGRLNFDVGEIAELELDRNNKFTSFLLSTPDGSQRIEPSLEQHTVSVTSVTAPGQYSIAAGGRQGVRLGFSVNLTPELTRLERTDVDELLSTLEESAPAVIRTPEELTKVRRVVQQKSRVDLAPWLIALLAIFISGEHFLSSFFYRKQNIS